MKLFRNLRLRWHQFMLKKRMNATAVERSSMSFKAAKSIGILFDATNEAHQLSVDNYTRVLQKQGKKVSLLAFVNVVPSEEVDPVQYPYFTPKDLSWYWHPKSEEAVQFINTRFDILLNLYLEPNISLEYISALSLANLRVGHHSEAKTHCYDLMIGKTKDRDLKSFIKEVDRFLNLMN